LKVGIKIIFTRLEKPFCLANVAEAKNYFRSFWWFI